jgi:predicted Zn finger-like uncharacterized protein
MFTTCPGCRMNLAVTANDLRIGQGYVRCGRCERVFNALMSLAEDLDPEAQSGLEAHGTRSLPALEDKEPRADQETPLDPTPVDVDLDVLDSAETGTVETIVLEGDTFTQTQEHIDEEEVRQRLQDLTGQHEIVAPQIDTDEPDHPDSDAQAVDAQAVDAQGIDSQEIDADEAVGNPPRQHWGWRVAVVALLAVLAGQVVHHERQALVANRWLETPLKELYSLFGVALEPAWDLTGYDVRQLGGEALALNSATIVLRATVQNRALHAQPPPLIRVRLQDRYGNALSTSAVPPDEYLKGTVPARMAPDQRLDVELHLDDPNRQAVSFDLDACLPTAAGAPRCAHDP